MNKVLVTGANGFVGSHILSSLSSDSNYEVIAACRDQKKIPFEFEGEVRQGDLRDQEYVIQMLQGVDMICHAASWTALWAHRKRSQELYLKPSLALIEHARQAGVKRFLNVSTTSAAAPSHSANPLSQGIQRSFWPHLNSVIALEEHLRQVAEDSFQVVNLRLGLFAGKNYALGLIPILLPRLRTHLVPWVGGGKTSMPIIDGEDIGEAFRLALKAKNLSNYDAFNIVGPETPTVKQVITYIHERFGYPLPHFNVPFFIAYPFAGLMELLHRVLPGDPLVTRSIIHLMEEVGVNNQKAEEKLNYHPRVFWQHALDKQISVLEQNKDFAMRMHKDW